MATNLADTGSDFDRNIALECDTCKLDGSVNSAAGFCKTCFEYLCNECLNHHCKPRLMRNHVVIGKDSMPKRRVSQEVLDIKCECGDKSESVKFYCQIDEKLLCINCAVNKHTKCPFRKINDESTGIENSRDYANFLKELNDSENVFKDEKDRAKHHREAFNKSYKQVIEEIQFMQRLLNEKLDHINRIEEEAVKRNEEYSTLNEDIEKECGSAVNYVRENMEDLKTIENTDPGEKLFVALRRSKDHLKKLKDKMENFKRGNVSWPYQFIPCDIMKNMLINVNETGKLTKELQNESKTSVTEYAEYGLPKCVALSTTCVVVIHRIHNTLQMFENDNIVAQIKLSSGPWDIAKVSSTIVVVTHPQEEKVSFIKRDDKAIHIEKEEEVNCRCEGIAYTDEKLYIASTKPPCIVVYDTKKSKEERRIVKDELFKQPAYIDVHPQSHLICVSDRKSNKVCILKDTGEDVREFECASMKTPLAVAFRDRAVLAIGFESNTINKIFYERQKEHAIETKSLHDVDINEVFKDPDFEMNASWKYCASKYFILVCKNSM